MFNLTIQATADENGGIRGGFAGDQSGIELVCKPFKPNNFTAVYRANDSAIAEQIATFMENATLNGYIGYCQTNRNDLFYKLSDVNFNVDLVNTETSCDCASLVYCALYSIFRIPYKTAKVYDAPGASTHPNYIENMLTGNFTKYDTDEYINSTANLQRGDILQRTEHIAVWI